jgi:N-acyl-D-aspartate/D-glutamate deacylase
VRFDIVVSGGEVIDGTGATAVRADVGIVGDRIAAIGDLGATEAGRRIAAVGHVVTPGFVDIHSHSDFTLLVDPEAESALSQGVTTEIVGNCGHGPAPLPADPDRRFTGNIYGWAPGVREFEWRSVGGYLDALEAARPAINLGTLVPFGNLRLLSVGSPGWPAAPDEVEAMMAALEGALDEGALGFSTGLEYAAETGAPPLEIEALVGIVGRRGRLHATHTRDRGLRVVEGTYEAIDTARRTGARTQVAHILARRGSGSPDANARIAESLELAARDGLPIAWDVHTRTFGVTNLSAGLVDGALRVGPDDATIIASFGRAGWDRTFLFQMPGRFGDFERRSVAEAAETLGWAPEEYLAEVLREGTAAGEPDRPMAMGLTYDESDIVAAIRTSRCAVASDATTMNLAGPLRGRMLPPAFGWAAWYLRRAIGELGALPLEQAIRRITWLPAAQAGLADRGRLVPGARADLAVLRLDALREPDPIRPSALATGVEAVLVNGRVAFEDGRVTSARAGEVIRA